MCYGVVCSNCVVCYGVVCFKLCCVLWCCFFQIVLCVMVLFVSRKEEHEQEVFLVARNIIVKSKQWKESSFQLLASWKERSR